MVSSQLGLIGCSLLVVAVALLKGVTADSYTVGEDLVFKWTGPHTVAEVTAADFSSCAKSNPIALYDSSPARITLSSLNGTRYFICTEDNHCSVLGQKVAITMGGTGQSDNSDDDDDWWRWNSASSLTIGTALSAVISTGATAVEYVVGDSLGWTLPPNTSFYSDWAASKTFQLGDRVSFKVTGNHTVYEATKGQYDNCSDLIGGISDEIQEIVTLDSAGSHYFVCIVGENCNQGMKMTITVESSTSAPMLLLRPYY
ncbi:hypothetical protein ACLB2K_009026 [Fragaria x ananassa]